MGGRRRYVSGRLPLFRQGRLSRVLRRQSGRSDCRYQTECGIYEPACGLDRVHMSWGHDEYLYHIVKDHLPDEGLAMIRYHSFYSAHREGAYAHLMNQDDRRLMDSVRQFNPYDLYSKGHEPPDVEALRPYYADLIAEYFTAPLAW